MSRDTAKFLVPPAMLVVAVAMAVAAHLHLGLAQEIAAAVGVSLFCLMLMCHMLLRVADEVDRAAEEAAERGIEQVASPMPATPPAETMGVEPLSETAVVAAVPASGEQVAGTALTMPQTMQHEVGGVTGAAPGWSFRPVDLIQPGGEPARAEAVSSPSDLRSLGAFRPTFAQHELRAAPEAGEMPLSVDREADRIDSILKRLANQIHAGAAERKQVAVPALPELGAAATPSNNGAGTDESAGSGAPEVDDDQLALPELGAAATPSNHGAGTDESAGSGAPEVDDDQLALEELAVANPDSALASAVDALRSTVEAMRGPAVPAGAEISAAAVSVAAVADAIQAESADVFLSPILGLADQSARHFEVSVKLRVETADERSIAEGAGLLPLLDALHVRHAAGFASMLGRRGRDGAVFSRIGGKSLESERFVDDVAGRHGQGVADRMVLSFAQDEMRGLGPAQFAALEDLARFGFRFALQGVADLNMDFEALQALGFEFVKLDATVFQSGLLCEGETVPASEICEHFEDLGLSVIVGDIGDAETRDRLVGWGVVYGQGALFGQPRPVPVATAAGTMAA